jgi:hypothetical protein
MKGYVEGIKIDIGSKDVDVRARLAFASPFWD